MSFLSLKANSYPELCFEKGLYEQAFTYYDSLYQDGNYSELQLYRMAYIQERKGNIPQASAYLYKLQLLYPDSKLAKHCVAIIEESGHVGIASANQKLIEEYVYANQVWSLLLMFFFLLAGFFFLYKKRLKAGIALLILAFLGASLSLYQNYSGAPIAVLIKPSSFYREPSFASENQYGLISVGSIVKIKSEQKPWTEIRVGKNSYWVPYFVLSRLK